MNDTKLVEALSKASSLELFLLSRIIDLFLARPGRIVATRNQLNLGKIVQFVDWRTGQMRIGKVIAIKDAQVTVHEEASRMQWKLSYAAIDPRAVLTPTQIDHLGVKIQSVPTRVRSKKLLKALLQRASSLRCKSSHRRTSAAATRCLCSSKSEPSHASTSALPQSNARIVQLAYPVRHAQSRHGHLTTCRYSSTMVLAGILRYACSKSTIDRDMS